MLPSEFLSIKWVLFLVFLTWHYALRCGYISDDHSGVAKRKDIIPDVEKKDKGESHWVKVFNDGIVVYYMNRIMWKLGLQNIPFAWHLLSLSLHLANTYLFYLVFQPVYGDPIALAACLFWGINPMLNQNVVWVSGRPYLMGAFLTLVGILNWQNVFIFFPLYMLAVITNLSIALAPVILWLWHPEAWQPKAYCLITMVTAFPFVLWKFQKRFSKSLVIDKENFRFKLRKFNTLVRVVLYYCFCLFVPTKMGWYHQAGFRYNRAWEKFNIWALVGYIFVGALIYYARFPGWWFLLFILPSTNLYATNSFVQDRYLYFASFGIALIVVPFLLQYPILFYCVLTFYGVRAYMYSRQLLNDESMYRENWRNHPQSDYAVNNLSYFLIQQKRYEEARVIILRGIELNKSNKMLWYNLGITWAATGHFNSDEGKFRFLRALDCWKMTLQIEPRWEKPANDIKKLVKILVEKKVLTVNVKDSVGPVVEIPALTGLKETMGVEGGA